MIENSDRIQTLRQHGFDVHLISAILNVSPEDVVASEVEPTLTVGRPAELYWGSGWTADQRYEPGAVVRHAGGVYVAVRTIEANGGDGDPAVDINNWEPIVDPA